MPSFEFADCPTRLDLTAAPDGTRTGSLRCTLRNTSSRRQTMRIRIEALSGARSDWFNLATAPPTSPLEIEEDIAAGSTLTVEALVKVPPQPAATDHAFRLRVTSEAQPDTDFAEGPAVAFHIDATERREVKRPFPWWAVAVAAVFLLVVAGGVAYLMWPRLELDMVRGHPLEEAKAIAAKHGFANIGAKPGEPEPGHDPAQQIVVALGKDDTTGATILLFDPGVLVPKVARSDPRDAQQALTQKGFTASIVAETSHVDGFGDTEVTRTSPPEEQPAAMGSAVTVMVNMKKPNSGGGGGGGVGPGGIHPCTPWPACILVIEVDPVLSPPRIDPRVYDPLPSIGSFPQ